MTERTTDLRAQMHALLDDHIQTALTCLDGDAPLMPLMARYHLGLVDTVGEPTSPETRRQVQGKRVRPMLTFLVAQGVGGAMQTAAPIAAAIELLHNFTLIHDDIQDRSPNRRHRPTVWRVWGDAQAINAGDALFAASQIAALRVADDLPAETTIRLAHAFNQCTIDIVRGQVEDLSFEGQSDITPDMYVRMITGKTASILRYAAWAGAICGGADDATATTLGEMALAVGLGFQIRDDLLGIWGPRDVTGKDPADDIRRRKQTLPILLLTAAASDEERATLAALQAEDEIDEDGVDTILTMLDRHGIAAATEGYVKEQHARAMTMMKDVFGDDDSDAVGQLQSLLADLEQRAF